MARPTKSSLPIVAALLLASAWGCTTKKQEAPALTGPSELGTSISITVSPDVLRQDGASQSLVTVTARDNSGQPLRNLTLRAEITVGGIITDFGSLSARNVVTDTSGRATFIYTAPPAGPVAIDTGTVVGITVSPMGTDFGNATSKTVDIRLVPTGVIGAPPSALRLAINLPAAVVGDTAVFTANITDSAGTDASASVASYQWTFGDGTTASGRTVTHTYAQAGNYPVTLTITDVLGRVGQTASSLTVGGGTNPTATFFSTPSSPNVGQSVSFNASTAVAAAGHTITSYAWDFGDGTTGSGATTTHAFTAAGSYTVLLTTTDDVGRKGTSTQTISVGAAGLAADFNFSPSSPQVGQSVNFDASTSQASTGRTITSYTWNFDDGTTGSGVQPSHAFNATGTFQVRLTATDDIGQTSTVVKPVTVGGQGAVTAFTFTPSVPIVNQTVSFDASQSRAATGRTITQYSWNFDDGGIAFGISAPHTFTVARTYQVRLTVTDNSGSSTPTSRDVVVTATADAPPTARLQLNPSSSVINSPIQADACASTATAGLTIVNYEFNWGDNRADSIVSGTNCRPTHSYSTLGSYTVAVIVRDSAGKIGSVTAPMSITSGAAPTAVFSYSPASPVAMGPAGITITVDASNSQAAQNATITSYEWNFGDNGAVVTSTTPTGVTHFYNNAGTYRITLTVHDNQAGSFQGPLSTTFRDITIGPTAIFFAPATISALTTVGFDGGASTPPNGATIVSYTWNFGDGFGASGRQVAHTFAGPVAPATSVSRIVTLTVMDSNGAQHSTSRTIVVNQ